MKQPSILFKYRQEKYLFHGSPIKIETLSPRQAHDTEYEAGCQEAVYATDNLDMAICFAMGWRAVRILR